jgi:hypothetical protein
MGTSYISTIHKTGSKLVPNNYRGIDVTVTSAIGKVFNRIMDRRLENYLASNNIIDDCQLGFTRSARTSNYMFVLKIISDEYCKSKEGRVYNCFV